MDLLSIDLEEGRITEEEAREMEHDYDIYLDRFPDPFGK